MEAFIGATISLISKSDIRYIGILHSINQVESTVALENVRSLGTEGRKLNSVDEIAASAHVFEFIVFRGSDIKDLQVVVAPQPQPQPQVPNDPAILSAAPQKPLASEKSIPPVTKPSEQPKPAVKAPQTAVQNVQDSKADDFVTTEDFSDQMGNLKVSDARKPPHSNSTQNQQENGQNSRNNSRGGHVNVNRGGRGGQRTNSQRNNANTFAVPSSDFDFESANAKFNKSEVVTIRPANGVNADAADGNLQNLPTTVDSNGSFYNKTSSFFDNISCEARDRAEGERRIVRGQEERKLNMETFGQASAGNRGRGNRGGRGRGGRGRGYYNNNSSNRGEGQPN
ncbi:hypothetical protein HDU78_011586 [Chytriomyces hyalinus]|nr:hypothetical protein HDU78_011586 [Chytriomyces hyalinus]